MCHLDFRPQFDAIRIESLSVDVPQIADDSIVTTPADHEVPGVIHGHAAVHLPFVCISIDKKVASNRISSGIVDLCIDSNIRIIHITTHPCHNEASGSIHGNRGLVQVCRRVIYAKIRSYSLAAGIVALRVDDAADRQVLPDDNKIPSGVRCHFAGSLFRRDVVVDPEFIRRHT